jgi:hypothetical protein
MHPTPDHPGKILQTQAHEHPHPADSTPPRTRARNPRPMHEMSIHHICIKGLAGAYWASNPPSFLFWYLQRLSGKTGEERESRERVDAYSIESRSCETRS